MVYFGMKEAVQSAAFLLNELMMEDAEMAENENVTEMEQETPEENENIDELKAELEKTRSALKKANEEAKKHRLKLKELEAPAPEPEQPKETPDPLKELVETVNSLKQQLDDKNSKEQREAKLAEIAKKAEELGYAHPNEAHFYVGVNMNVEDIEEALKRELEIRPHLKTQAPKTQGTNPGGVRNGETREQRLRRLGLR